MSAGNVTIWLLRHGATEWTADHRLCGWSDPPLNDLGRSQARAVRGRIGEIRPESVWSSDLARCVETAVLVGAGHPRIDTRLREFDFGRLEGRRFEDLGEETRRGLASFDGFEAPGGETVDAFARRVDEFIAELEYGRHLLVTHGGVIRHLLRTKGLDRSIPPAGLEMIEV